MKKQHYNRILILVFLIVIVSSCKRTLEPEPLELLSSDYVWDTEDSAGVKAGQFLNDIYNTLPKGHNRILGLGDGADFLDAATDDAVSSSVSRPPVELIATGIGITPFGNEEGGNSFIQIDFWAVYYKGIRKANIFMANIDKVPLAGTITGNRPLRSAWKAEARFLRAFFYFELVKRYGGMPIMGDKVLDINDNALLPRNSFAECIDYIVNECDAVKDSLRYDPIDDQNFGRVTRGAALALKARALLYAASPLYNGGNTGTTPAQQLVAGYPAFDMARWQRAADAAQEIIDLGVFKLETNFKNIFTDPLNDEVIFARNNGANMEIEDINGPLGFVKGDGRTSPSQELVEAFPMRNGKPITDPSSGFKADSPYLRRDPRLTHTVLYNGARWLKTDIKTYEQGRNKPGGPRVQTKTSYYLRKFMGPFEEQTQYAATSHNFIYFRLAEVILNLAEAKNEVEGPSETVYGALRALRVRAGITSAEDYGLPHGITKEQMRDFIHNERRIELAFEEHRYWDIRRWKFAETLNGKPVSGVSIIFSVAENKIISRNKIEIYKFVFDRSKMYLYPVSQNELNKNRNLIQNPGW